MSAGSLRFLGINGFYWGATTSPSEFYAYDLDFYNSNVYPSTSNARWAGFAVQR